MSDVKNKLLFGCQREYENTKGVLCHTTDIFWQVLLRHLPHVSGNLWKRKFFFTNTARVLVTSVFSGCIQKSLKTLSRVEIVSGNFRIRFRHSLGSSLHGELYKQTWRTARLLHLAVAMARSRNFFWDHFLGELRNQAHISNQASWWLLTVCAQIPRRVDVRPDGDKEKDSFVTFAGKINLEVI